VTLLRARKLLPAAPALAATLLLCCTTAAPAMAKSPSTQTLAAYLKEDKALAYEFATIEGAKLGVTLPGGPESFLDVKQSASSRVAKGVGLATTGCSTVEEEWHSCEIDVGTLTHTKHELLRATMAHEVFHTYEAVMCGKVASCKAFGFKWLVEGAAEWAAVQIVGNDSTSRRVLGEYFSRPSRPLFSREYDAMGFFNHMQSVGVDPWPRFKTIFLAQSEPAAYAAAISGNQTFLETEASVFFREGSWPWSERPAAQPTPGKVHFKPSKLSVGPKEKVLVKVAPYADGVYRLSLKPMTAKRPVLEAILKRGYARIRSKPGTAVDEDIAGDIKLCSDPKGCSCPTHPDDYPQFKEGDLAVTGTSTGAVVELIPVKRCEALLSSRSCEGILPGFTTEAADAIDGAANGIGAGKPFEKHEEAGPNGYYSSSCIALIKGAFVEYTAPATVDSEGVEVPGQTQTLLNGVIANVNVTRYSTVEDATTAFQNGAVGVGGTTVHAVGGIQEEAAAGTREILSEEPGFGGVELPVKNGLGQNEYFSVGYVRVRNIVASIQLGGNEEADGEGIYRVLQEVSGEL
jgi:hypothetical protein